MGVEVPATRSRLSVKTLAGPFARHHPKPSLRKLDLPVEELMSVVQIAVLGGAS